MNKSGMIVCAGAIVASIVAVEWRDAPTAPPSPFPASVDGVSDAWLAATEPSLLKSATSMQRTADAWDEIWSEIDPLALGLVETAAIETRVAPKQAAGLDEVAAGWDDIWADEVSSSDVAADPIIAVEGVAD